MIGSLGNLMFKLHNNKPSNYVLGVIFVVNIKFPRATYHTIVPSTEERYYLNSGSLDTKQVAMIHVQPLLKL